MGLHRWRRAGVPSGGPEREGRRVLVARSLAAGRAGVHPSHGRSPPRLISSGNRFARLQENFQGTPDPRVAVGIERWAMHDPKGTGTPPMPLMCQAQLGRKVQTWWSRWRYAMDDGAAIGRSLAGSAAYGWPRGIGKRSARFLQVLGYDDTPEGRLRSSEKVGYSATCGLEDADGSHSTLHPRRRASGHGHRYLRPVWCAPRTRAARCGALNARCHRKHCACCRRLHTLCATVTVKVCSEEHHDAVHVVSYR